MESYAFPKLSFAERQNVAIYTLQAKAIKTKSSGFIVQGL